MRLNKTKIMFALAKKGWTQNDLAKEAGMSRTRLSILINGKNCAPRTVLRLSEALGLEIEEILESKD